MHHRQNVNGKPSKWNPIVNLPPSKWNFGCNHRQNGKVAYRCTFVSTFSTETTETVGTDGSTTPETVYHVETPSTLIISTTTSGWTGAFTTTYSTETTETVGTDGSTTPEILYHVETPFSFYYGNTSRTMITRKNSPPTQPPMTLSTATLIFSGFTTELRTAALPKSDVSETSTALVYSYTSSVVTVSGPSNLFSPSILSENIFPNSVTRVTVSTPFSKTTFTGISSTAVTSATSVSDWKTITTLVPVTTTYETASENCSETSSKKTPVSFTVSAASWDKSENPNETESSSTETRGSNATPAERMTSEPTEYNSTPLKQMTRTLTYSSGLNSGEKSFSRSRSSATEANTQSESISLPSLEIYASGSTASVSSIVISTYAGGAERSYGYPLVLLAALPLPFI